MSDTPFADKVSDLVADLRDENARLRMKLDASCNAEELRQVRAENTTLRAALERISTMEDIERAKLAAGAALEGAE